MLPGQATGGGIAFGAVGQVTVFQGVPLGLARSDYLAQVGQLAPQDLQGRESELAELARFCLDPDGASYAWWQAGPWAGKTALLSTFVKDPPAELAGRVQIVSFFVTAPLAGQDSRAAFTEVLLEQLAALLGQVLPAALPGATRESRLLGLLSRAAAACQAAGGRLVLVVDGLDEDRGVTTGPDARSIAGLLPVAPLAGMRVIVSGRPDPPVPDDVPGLHPLRDPAIIRPLADSPHAQDMQRLATVELKRLLGGSTAEQDLLGLLAAARGGLSGPDLAKLVGIAPLKAERILHTVAGRTFSSRPSLTSPGTRPEAYLLAHEELQAAATRSLHDRLAGYRERLHAWAAGYRDRRWPPDTPEYLLGGYFRLLEDLGDLPRMTELALDFARHDRMLDLTGGDAAALAEARTTLDRIAAQEDPDLASALALACHRDHLANRNAHIPAVLPAVWAALGQFARAETLARSITSPSRKALALARVAAALAQAGQLQHAATIATQAQATGGSLYAGLQAAALAQVAGALAGAGLHEQSAAIVTQAEAVARSNDTDDIRVRDLSELAAALADVGLHEQSTAIVTQAQTLVGSVRAPHWTTPAEVAEALARTGQHQQAEAMARSITDWPHQQTVLARVAGALARTGQHQQAEAMARSITDPASQSTALARVAETLSDAGLHEQAAAIATRALAPARSITDWPHQQTVLARVAAVLARAGQHQQAEAMARSITGRASQARVPISIVRPLARVAGALARAGQHEQAAAVVRQARAAASSFTGPASKVRALADVARALAAEGQHEQAAAIATEAQALAGSVRAPHEAEALAEEAGALAGAGLHEQAAAIAAQAQATIGSVLEPFYQARALAQAAGALSAAGLDEQGTAIARQAQAVADSITNPGEKARALAEAAGALSAAGLDEQGAAIARQAQAVADSITNPAEKMRALQDVAVALARAGQHQQAVTVAAAESIPARARISQADVLVRVAGALAQAGQYEQAEAVADSITGRESLRARQRAMTEVAVALARAGQHQQAEAMARSITDESYRPRLLAEVAVALGRAGQHEQAKAMARQAEAVAGSIRARWKMQALVEVAGALAWSGQHEQAQTVARSITSPGHQAAALTQVAAAMARAGEVRPATRAAAVLCSVAAWPTAVAPVLRLAPSAATTLARTLAEQRPAEPPVPGTGTS